MTANERYLWAWFMGGMIMMTKLEGEPEWQPLRYAAQLSDDYGYFYPRKGWAWGDLFICLAAPPDTAFHWPPYPGGPYASPSYRPRRQNGEHASSPLLSSPGTHSELASYPGTTCGCWERMRVV